MVAPEDITRQHDWGDRKNDDIWIGRRSAPEPMVIVEHDPAWPDRYDAVAEQIRVVASTAPTRRSTGRR